MSVIELDGKGKNVICGLNRAVTQEGDQSHLNSSPAIKSRGNHILSVTNRQQNAM